MDILENFYRAILQYYSASFIPIGVEQIKQALHDISPEALSLGQL
jgi:hypothetical protein